jgi:transcription termination factor 2
MYLAAIIHEVESQDAPGIPIRYRTDGGLFNLRRLRARTLTTTSSISELQYADDNAVLTHTTDDNQRCSTIWNNAYKKFGFTVNLVKTKSLSQTNDVYDRVIRLDDTEIETVQKFPYLGSSVSQDYSLDSEILCRLRAAHCSYGKLSRRVFNNHSLKTSTKLAVYKAVVITTLLYACETWTLYQRQLKLLEQFHQGKLRKIMRIRWEQRVSNVKVLERANTTSIEAMVARHRLRWIGHVQRMPDDRLPKRILYAELVNGNRPVGGPKKRFKDQLKRTLIASDIPLSHWVETANDRTRWRQVCEDGIQRLETTRRTKERQKKEAKKQRAEDRALGRGPMPTIPCPHCDRLFLSRLGLYSHSRTHR